MSEQVGCLSPQAIPPDSNQALVSQADGSGSDSLSLATFKSHLGADGLYRPAIDDARASHDDTTLMYVSCPSPLESVGVSNG